MGLKRNTNRIGVGRRWLAGVLVMTLSLAAASIGFGPTAAAQDIDSIVASLESQSWYIEPGGDGTASGFDALVRETDSAKDEWYFVSLAGPVDPDFADTLRQQTRPTGNVIVYFIDSDDFLSVQLASGSTESLEDQSLAPFDDPSWTLPNEFMDDVVREFDRLTGSTATTTGNTSTGTGSTSTPQDSSSGGGAGWLWLAIPAALIGGAIWFSGRRRSAKTAESELETAQKIRAEIQSELDELANDVIVLSEPVDLSEDDTAIDHYRKATATYTAISDEIPNLDELESANLAELSELGARVAHARWQMDAAEAIIGGDPIPEKPKVEPPPPRPNQNKPTPGSASGLPPNMPSRQPRPRVPYSRSRRRSGGGLLDILIAGAGMLGGSSRSRGRSSGGMFGGSRRSGGPMFGGGARTNRSRSPRAGGGVFGGNSSRSSRGTSSSRRTATRRSTSRSRPRRSGDSSRSRSRASSSRRSTSRRRRR